jgi:hypothetical protein
MEKEHIWTCEICINNSHKEVRMVKRVITSTDENGYWKIEMLCCPNCGSIKSLQ